MFIVFEGVEGSGKTTQLQRVAAALRERGIDPVVTREPGGTPVGEAVREILLDARRRLDPEMELLLILTARAALVREVIRPALEADRVVLSDRYDLSTFAYQGGGRGLPIEEIRRLNERATGRLRADLYIVLDVSAGEGLHRKAGRPPDRIEGDGPEFHDRVARAYRELADSEANVVRVEATRGRDAVYEEIERVLAERFPKTLGADAG